MHLKREGRGRGNFIIMILANIFLSLIQLTNASRFAYGLLAIRGTKISSLGKSGISFLNLKPLKSKILIPLTSRVNFMSDATISNDNMKKNEMDSITSTIDNSSDNIPSISKKSSGIEGCYDDEFRKLYANHHQNMNLINKSSNQKIIELFKEKGSQLSKKTMEWYEKTFYELIQKSPKEIQKLELTENEDLLKFANKCRKILSKMEQDSFLKSEKELNDWRSEVIRMRH